MTPPVIPPLNPDCCICGNAYGTRFVCGKCRSDPANSDWVEDREDPQRVAASKVRRTTTRTPSYTPFAYLRDYAPRRNPLYSKANARGTSFAAWREWQISIAYPEFWSFTVARLCQVAAPEAGLPNLDARLVPSETLNLRYGGIVPGVHGLSTPPRWFIQHELGYEWGESPSLEWTCEHLAQTNRAALLHLGLDAPERVTYPLNFSRDPRGRRREPRARDRHVDAGSSAPSREESISEIRARHLGG